MPARGEGARAGQSVSAGRVPRADQQPLSAVPAASRHAPLQPAPPACSAVAAHTQPRPRAGALPPPGARTHKQLGLLRVGAHARVSHNADGHAGAQARQAAGQPRSKVGVAIKEVVGLVLRLVDCGWWVWCARGGAGGQGSAGDGAVPAPRLAACRCRQHPAPAPLSSSSCGVAAAWWLAQCPAKLVAAAQPAQPPATDRMSQLGAHCWWR